MNQKIAIIDYQMGNLKSVAKAIEHVGGQPVITRNPRDIVNASKIILPGVGAFGACMKNLIHFELNDLIKTQIHNGKSFLGICLGLQLLFESSEETAGIEGLAVFRGTVKKFNAASPDPQITGLKIPHMGWNQLQQKHIAPLLKGIANEAEFYFVHSYYVEPQDKSIIASTTSYGIDFCSSISHNNVFACQFHPEKSQKNGLALLKNFVDL